jgi:uncharacterized membrane protein
VPVPSEGGAAWRRAALGAWLALLALVSGWEAFAAPPTPVPRGFWLLLKTAPLLAPLPALLRGGARAHVLAALIALLYFSVGVATAYDAGRRGEPPALLYGLAETALAAAFVVAAGAYARLARR